MILTELLDRGERLTALAAALDKQLQHTEQIFSSTADKPMLLLIRILMEG